MKCKADRVLDLNGETMCLFTLEAEVYIGDQFL